MVDVPIHVHFCLSRNQKNLFIKTSSRVWLRFEEIVKVTEGYHVYSGLSLFAEIGGYVGLLLGVSLNQVTKIVDSLVVYLQKLMMNRIQVHD